MGAPSCSSNEGTAEKGQAGAGDARTAEVAKRIRGVVHKNNKNKRLSHVQSEMEKLMHHDEQELSVWEGCHWDDKGGWLDPELCAKANVRR